MIHYTHIYIYYPYCDIQHLYVTYIYILYIYSNIMLPLIAHLYMIIRSVVAHSYLKLPDDIRG